MKRWLFALLLALGGLKAYEAPLSLSAILKEVHSAALFTLYAPSYGYLYCSLYGAVAPLYTDSDSPCQIDPKKAREMRYHARNFTLRQLYMEQQYRLGYVQGFCLLQAGAHLFNATLIKEGYAVAQNSETSGESELLRGELFRLEEIARREQKGLWKEWKEEMECLSLIANSRR